jgi:hypothetical protein
MRCEGACRWDRHMIGFTVNLLYNISLFNFYFISSYFCNSTEKITHLLAQIIHVSCRVYTQMQSLFALQS